MKVHLLSQENVNYGSLFGVCGMTAQDATGKLEYVTCVHCLRQIEKDKKRVARLKAVENDIA